MMGTIVAGTRTCLLPPALPIPSITVTDSNNEEEGISMKVTHDDVGRLEPTGSNGAKYSSSTIKMNLLGGKREDDNKPADKTLYHVCNMFDVSI